MTSYTHPAPAPVHRRILVPLDGSDLSAGALATADALAERFGATVHTVSVVVSELGIEWARAQAADALGTDPDDFRIHVEIDLDVADAVQRCAAELDASLLCLSSHGRGRVSGTLIGSTARAVIDRAHAPVVVAGPLVARPDGDDDAAAPLAVDRLVACVDGTRGSELGLPVAAAWADALGMKLAIVTVAEPCPPPMRIGAPWRRHHGPDEDADEYIVRLGEQWSFAAPGVETAVVYDPIGPGSGMRDHLASHPAGLVAVTSHVRPPLAHLVFGSGAAEIVHISPVPALVLPVQAVEG